MPLERPFSSSDNSWRLAPIPWSVIKLPATTHAVLVGPIDDPLNLQFGANGTTSNLAVFQPLDDKVTYGRIERAIIENAGDFETHSVAFQPQLLNRQGQATATPLATERIFLTSVPGVANAVFYALPSELLAWKIPLHVGDDDNFSNDVRGAVFNLAPPATIQGIIPFGASQDEAWLAVTGGGVDQLLRVAFNQ